MPGVSCKAVATQNSSEWPCSMCPIPPGSGLWGWGHSIYIFLIFPGYLEFWTPLQIPSWGPPLGCLLLQLYNNYVWWIPHAQIWKVSCKISIIFIIIIIKLNIYSGFYRNPPDSLISIRTGSWDRGPWNRASHYDPLLGGWGNRGWPLRGTLHIYGNWASSIVMLKSWLTQGPGR